MPMSHLYYKYVTERKNLEKSDMSGDELAKLKICSFWVVGCFLGVLYIVG